MRKLYSAEAQTAMQYVEREPEYNIFIIGDIENHGVDSENVEIFVLDGKDGYDCLVLRYLSNYVMYSHRTDYDAAAVANFLMQRTVKNLSGKAAAVAPVASLLPGRKKAMTYLARLDEVQVYPLPENSLQRMLSPEDARQIIELYLQVEEFAENYSSNIAEEIENMAFSLSRGGSCSGVFIDGILASVAMTTAENSRSAMIIGVATLPQYCGRGLASAAVSGLCAKMLQSGKEFVCLFYDNPAAGRIYRRIGFQEMGEYLLLRQSQE